MSGVATAIAGTAVLGYMSSQNAAGAQADAAAQSDATQRYIYDQNRADQAPYRDAGYNALSRLVSGLQPGGDYSRRFTAADMANDPVYQSGLQFGLDEGVKGLNRQAAATGRLLSGATLKALTKYGNDYASTKANDSYNRFNTDMNNSFNRNASIAGLGQTANGQVASAGQNYANNVSNTAIGLGNARGASMIAGTNALANGVGQYMGYSQNNQLLQALQRNGGYGGGAGSIYNGGYNFDNGNMISGLGG